MATTFFASGSARAAAIAFGAPAMVIAGNVMLGKQRPVLLDTTSALKEGIIERLTGGDCPPINHASEQTMDKILKVNSVAHSHGNRIHVARSMSTRGSAEKSE